MILNLFEPGGTPIDQHHSADMVATASVGVVQVVSDPRSTIPQALNALLTAELTDNAGGELLIKLARDTVKTTWRRTLSRRCTANAAMRQKCRAGSKRRCSSPLERISCRRRVGWCVDPRYRSATLFMGTLRASSRLDERTHQFEDDTAERLVEPGLRTARRHDEAVPTGATPEQGIAGAQQMRCALLNLTRIE
jgi:hypothetical protein